jgi:hypothetical protein
MTLHVFSKSFQSPMRMRVPRRPIAVPQRLRVPGEGAGFRSVKSWRRWTTGVLLAACIAGGVAPAQAHKGKAVSAISAVTLERHCMGCADELTLRLQRDGTALLTLPGHARLGRTEQRLSGKVSPQAFDALARQLVAARFMSLDAIYEDPQMRDGSTSTISVEAGQQVKQVISRDGWGPQVLLDCLASIEAAKAAIAFKVLP